MKIRECVNKLNKKQKFGTNLVLINLMRNTIRGFLSRVCKISIIHIMNIYILQTNEEKVIHYVAVTITNM